MSILFRVSNNHNAGASDEAVEILRVRELWLDTYRQSGLGPVSGPRVFVTANTLLVLASNTRVLRFLPGKEKASLRWPYLTGAQKRTLCPL